MTSRMTADYPFTSWVTVDGTRIPCTAADLGAGKPTILDGLTFNWGRQSSVDQPDTETCSFTIREQLSDAVTTLQAIHVGSHIEIWTEGDVVPSQAETMTQTGFPVTGPLDPMRWNRRSGDNPTITVSRAPGFAWNAAWLAVPGNYNWATQVAFPPDVFQPAGTNPGAWDGIARLLPGQQWNYTAQVWVPAGVTVNLTAYGYSGPHSADYAGGCPVSPPATPTGNTNTAVGNWHWLTLAGTIRLSSAQTDPAGYWIAAGIQLVNMPAPATWAQTPGLWSDQTLRWIDYNQAGVSFLSITHDTESIRDVLVWSGQVTSLVSQAAGDKAYTTAVTCADISTALANLKVGDVPWNRETVQARANHIVALVPTAPPITIDAGLRPIMVSYRDVDAQPPLGLLQDLAQTAGGIMWITSHATQGVYLWMEDIDNRAAVRRFVIDPVTGLVTIGPNVAAEDVAIISARDILRDPVAWTQDVSIVITQVSVGWLEQITDPDSGQPSTNDHTEIVQASAADLNRYGIRDLSVSTELTTQTDAIALASRLLSQAKNTGWLASGFTLDTVVIDREIPTVDYATRVDIIMDLLDATDRIGMAVTLIDNPAWTPATAVASMYVEGGTYTWTDYRWNLDLTASPAAGQGESATWNDFQGTPARWVDFARTIHWQDGYGTAGPQ
jgi:hypothetical protein